VLAAMQMRAWVLGNRHGARYVTDLILDLSWAAQIKALPTEH
jgi:hypothetical protein